MQEPRPSRKSVLPRINGAKPLISMQQKNCEVPGSQGTNPSGEASGSHDFFVSLLNDGGNVHICVVVDM